MTITFFLRREQRLINEVAKGKDADYSLVARLMKKHIGDMDFNARLASELYFGSDDLTKQQVAAMENLAYFCFKTRKYRKAEMSLEKAELIQLSKEEGVELEAFEKMSLNDMNELDQLSTAFNKAPEFWNEVAKHSKQGAAFHKVAQNITKSKEMLAEIHEDALQSSGYKSGDLVINRTSKVNAYKARTPGTFGYGGELAEKLITKYSHAAPVLIDRANPAKPKYQLSDVNAMQRVVGIELGDMLTADSFAIDPSKLVSKEKTALLAQIDYGNKRDKDGNELKGNDGQPIKITWQEVMQERYNQLSYAMHASQEAFQEQPLLQERDKGYKEYVLLKGKLEKMQLNYKELHDEKKASSASLEMIKQDLKALNKEEKKVDNDIHGRGAIKKHHRKQKAAFARRRKKLKHRQASFQTRVKQLDSKLEGLNNDYKIADTDLNALVAKIGEKDKELDKKHDRKIKLDEKRLVNPSIWIGTAISSLSHKLLFRKNNARDLSEKMFSATQEKKAMICSEFAGRSISACMHELNRLTAAELETNGLGKRQDLVIANPIPANEDFNKLHPERLVTLLKKAKCAKQLHNPALTAIIQTENVKLRKASPVMDYFPQKLYSVLRKSTNVEQFNDQASKVIKVYLQHAKVPAAKVNAAMQGMDKQLDKIYTQYTKQPSGIKEHLNAFCNKVLEAVGLRTKDKEVKVALKKAASKCLTSAMRKQQNLRRASSSKRRSVATATRGAATGRVR